LDQNSSHAIVFRPCGAPDQIYGSLNAAMRTRDERAIAFWRPFIWELDQALMAHRRLLAPIVFLVSLSVPLGVCVCVCVVVFVCVCVFVAWLSIWLCVRQPLPQWNWMDDDRNGRVGPLPPFVGKSYRGINCVMDPKVYATSRRICYPEGRGQVGVERICR